MAVLVDAVERSRAEWPREAHDIEAKEKQHRGSTIVRDKYLPVLFGSLPSRSGNYSSQPTSKNLLEQQRGGDASVEKENHTHPEPKASAATKDGLLISNPRVRDNSCPENIDIATTNNKCIIGKNYQVRPHGLEQQQHEQRSIQLIQLLIVTLICLHNAPSCASFSVPNNDNNTGLSRNDNYRQHHLINDQSISLPLRWPNRIKRGVNEHSTRSFYEMNPWGDLSTIFGSFSQDGPGGGPPGNGAQQSWTSIFGGSGSPSGSNGGGGDALDVHVKNILVPRVSGSPGNIKVRQYIIDVMRKNDYQVELDEFTGSTPIGNVKFANIIASSQPGACRQLVLACHYDSKLQEGFLGATDSAVPCAMLLKIAETHNKSFRSDDSGESSLGLRFIFFDGEEAFVQWTATDSLYGSRHLAAKWAKQQAPGQCQSKFKNELERIELFVLLDLIGASDTTFVMYNTQLRHHYESLQKHERSFLVKGGLNQVQARRQAAFKGRTMALDFVEDDHVPFKKRGVPILLLLAHPFPRVWHTNADNYESIDWQKTRRILHVMEEFVSSYPNNKST